MNKDKFSMVLLIASIVSVIFFIVFSIIQYNKQQLTIEILKDISLTLSLAFNITFSFRIIKISIRNSFNNNKIIINKNISYHDEQLASKLEKPFENLKRAIKREERYTQNNFYSELYRISVPVLNNFSSPKYVFESKKLQGIFDSIKVVLNKFINLYSYYNTEHVFGEMAMNYISNRNELSKYIDDFYNTLVSVENCYEKDS